MMMNVGNMEKRNVSELNNELFIAGKKIMEESTKKPQACWHIGWSSLGDYIDWLEANYEIVKRSPQQT
jgi:hypothetical protein